MMEQAMYCGNYRNSLNAVLERAVQVQTRCGSNRTGAIATLADWLGVSPRIVEMRINDEIVGEPRSKGLLAAKVWEFLAHVERRERAWVENLAAEVEQTRLRLQLDLPLTGQKYDPGTETAAAELVSKNESDLAAARRALAEFEAVKRRTGR